jgi:ubiquinone/menaquinone biosynthesis C-methylase UbiE
VADCKYSKYADVVPEYKEYVRIQKGCASFESEFPGWKAGQERCIKTLFQDIDRDKKILDIACGDGVGLGCFKDMGFKNITGVEFTEAKAERAITHGYPVFLYDMNDLSKIDDDSYDIVYSSHSLEHAYYPQKAIEELYRIIKHGGQLFVILPYPDPIEDHRESHGGKYELGTYMEDNGIFVTNFFLNIGFSLVDKKFDDYRQKEIWLSFKKGIVNG